jgi:hypothetical protein
MPYIEAEVCHGLAGPMHEPAGVNPCRVDAGDSHRAGFPCGLITIIKEKIYATRLSVK